MGDYDLHSLTWLRIFPNFPLTERCYRIWILHSPASPASWTLTEARISRFYWSCIASFHGARLNSTHKSGRRVDLIHVLKADRRLLRGVSFASSRSSYVVSITTKCMSFLQTDIPCHSVGRSRSWESSYLFHNEHMNKGRGERALKTNCDDDRPHFVHMVLLRGSYFQEKSSHFGSRLFICLSTRDCRVSEAQQYLGTFISHCSVYLYYCPYTLTHTHSHLSTPGGEIGRVNIANQPINVYVTVVWLPWKYGREIQPSLFWQRWGRDSLLINWYKENSGNCFGEICFKGC